MAGVLRLVCSGAAPAPPDAAAVLDALDRLQASVRKRNVDLEQWERENVAERHATAVERARRLAVKGFEPLTQRI